jgi:hypothetical protein
LAFGNGGNSTGLINSSGTFYSHAEIQPGRYKLTSIWLSTPGAITEIRDLTTISTKLPGAVGLTSTQIDLSAYSFEIADTGKYQPFLPQLIQKISIGKSGSNSSDQYNLIAELSGESYLSTLIFFWKDSAGSLSNTYCHMYPNNGPENACKLVSSVLRKSYLVTIPIPITKDVPEGAITIETIIVNSRYGLAGVLGNASSYMWGTGATYEKGTSTVNIDGRYSAAPIDFSRLTFANLTPSPIVNRSPTWSKVSWQNSIVAAGSYATLLISLDASARKISQLNLWNLIGAAAAGYQNLQLGGLPRIRRLDDPAANGLFPGTSRGDFAIDVWIPRTAKPGTYTIGQLTVISTTCDFSTKSELNGPSKENGANCQDGSNSWNTTYNTGSLVGAIWPGYASLASLTMEITPPGQIAPPPLGQFKITSTSIDYKLDFFNRYEYQNCNVVSTQGTPSLSYDSLDYSMHVMIIGLQPDSDVKFELSCSTSDGISIKSGQILEHTSKPSPPSVPSLTFQNQNISILKLSFAPDPDLTYNATSSSGNVSITNGTLSVTNYDPNAKIAVTLSATDLYFQTSIGNTEYYLPSAPGTPVFKFVKQDLKGMHLSYTPKQGLTYKVFSSTGKVTDVAGKVLITGLAKGVRLRVQLTATDSFQQISKSKNLSLQFKGSR